MRPLTCIIAITLTLSVTGISAQYKLDARQLKLDPYAWLDQQNDQQNSGIVNGEYYEIKRISKHSHQFFGDDSWVLGEIIFRDQLFDSVYMTYDIHSDLLLIRHPTQYIYHNQPIKPVQEQISSFQILEHQFIRIDEQKLNGFYDLLFSGQNLRLVVKRHKQTYVENSVEFEPDNRYYLHKDGNYLPLKRKSSILKIFPGNKKDIKTFINRNRLDIRPGNDSDYIRIIDYLDSQIGNSL